MNEIFLPAETIEDPKFDAFGYLVYGYTSAEIFKLTSWTSGLSPTALGEVR